MKKENNRRDYDIFMNIISEAPGHFYWKDTEGVCRGSNNAQAIFLGYKEGKDLIGKTDFDFFPKDQAKAIRKIDIQVMTTQKEYCIEEIVRNPEGKNIIFLSRKIPLFEPNTKQVIGLIGISLDITASKQAELAKRQFIMNMAHDLRTPLSGIIGIAGIQADLGTSAKDKKYGLWTLNAGRQLLELLDAVLEIISTENMEDPMVENIIDLSFFVNELQALIQPAVVAKNLRFELVLDSNLPIIISDQLKLKRILLNLLSNAVKFTKKGKVSLEIKLLSIRNNQAKIKILINDTGIGIPQNKLDKIFDRFYRVLPSSQTEYKGYGIGLFLVKKAVELLDGEIKVSSQEGKGSCFTVMFSFPLSKEKIEKVRPPISQPSPSKPADKQTQSVLIAEDNTLALHVAKKLLFDLGYEVTTVMNGKAALKALQTQCFDWALLDIGLPDLDGTEIVRRFRQWEQKNKKSHLPIFALTAHLEKNIVDKCKSVGFDYVLNKPFTEKDIQIIQKIID